MIMPYIVRGCRDAYSRLPPRHGKSAGKMPRHSIAMTDGWIRNYASRHTRSHTCLDVDGIIARAVVARVAGMVVCYGQNHLTLRAMAYGLFCRCILCFGGWDGFLGRTANCAGRPVSAWRDIAVAWRKLKPAVQLSPHRRPACENIAKRGCQ